MINRPFAEVFENRASNMDVNNVKVKVFNELFEEKSELAIQFFARGVAGHYEDKDWGRYMGNRNSGKGVFGEIAQNALEKYCTTIDAGHFLAERNTADGDQAKKNSWMIPLQFNRIALTQEMKFDNENRNVKIDSVTIKKFASGGDKLEGRLNYENEIYFNIDARLMIMCNDNPPYTSQDVLESCVSFETTKQFKSKAWIEAEEKMMIEQGDEHIWMLEKKKYKVGDNNIKKLCQSVEYANAFILLLLENYKNTPVTANTSMGDDENDVNLNRIMLKHFTFTGHSADFVSNADIKKWILDLKLNVSMAKVKAELIGQNCVAKKKIVHGFTGVKIKPIVVDVTLPNN
jgi:hypothetical protein